MGKTAVVIGATGLVGTALIDKLAECDAINSIVSLTRQPASHTSPKVHNTVVDFDHLEKQAELFQGDLLFSCLGTTKKQAGSIQAQRKVDIDYQYTAAKLAANNKVNHYLLVSSSGANAKSGNAYLRMKGELEQKIKLLPFDSVSIFQPSLLLGKRKELRMGEKLGMWMLPVISFIPWLRRYRPIRGEQVAAKMVQTSQTPGPKIQLFVLDEIFNK